MAWLLASFYDRFMRVSEEACLRRWRAELLRDLGGEVLEVGAGTGASLPFYPASVTRLVLAEPDPNLRRRLRTRCEGTHLRHVEVSSATLKSLPAPAASFDAVFSSLVLCSVPDLPDALWRIGRLLRPGGRFVFIEHVAAESRPDRLKWQRRLEPIWRRLMGNCHLTRRTEQAIAASGLAIEQIRRESMRKALPIVRPSIRGIARKPGP